jgi:hypothetical protein
LYSTTLPVTATGPAQLLAVGTVTATALAPALQTRAITVVG